MKLLTSAVAVLAVAQGALADACSKQREVQDFCRNQQNVKWCMCQGNSVGDFWKSAIDCSDSKKDECARQETWRHIFLDFKERFCNTQEFPENDFDGSFNTYFNRVSWKFDRRY